MDHSPEPWKPFWCNFILDEDRKHSCCGYTNGYGDVIHLTDSREECGHVVDLVDMRRICACVNACEGIPDEALEALHSGDKPSSDEHWYQHDDDGKVLLDPKTRKPLLTDFGRGVCEGVLIRRRLFSLEVLHRGGFSP